jgi:hypothetical protein
VHDLASLPLTQRALTWVSGYVEVSADQLRTWVATGAQRALEPLASMGGQLFLGALGTIAASRSCSSCCSSWCATAA